MRRSKGSTTQVWIGDEIALDLNGSTTVSSYIHGQKLIQSGYGWYLYNAHGDVTALTNASGSITRNYDYDPYGVQYGSVDSADSNPYRYCGEYYDKESGYTYLRARYYDPAIGRFVSEDPALDGWNWYVYCWNNPLSYIDPSGYLILPSSTLKCFFDFTAKSAQKRYKETKNLLASAGSAYLGKKGYKIAQALYNHGMWGNGTALSKSTKDMVTGALKKSDYFNETNKNALNKVKGSSVNRLKVSMKFESGDLLFGIGKIDFYLTGAKKSGKWTVAITGTDRYDFDNIRSFEKLSFGNAANDLGWAMQRAGMLTPYYWTVSFNHTY